MMVVESEVAEQVQNALHQAGVRPRGVQNTAIDCGLLDGRSVAVVSPTGSGKTLVGEMALLRAALKGQRGLYLVPLRALAIQVSAVLTDRYTPVGIRVGLSTGDFDRNGEALSDYDIIVTTYERADSLVRRGASWLSEVGTLVVDEVQTLSDVGRGARLESVIIRLKRLIGRLQIVALSATIRDPEELAEWLDCRLVSSDERPVPLVHRIIATDSKLETLRTLVMTTVQGDGQAIVFHRTRRQAEAQAARIGPDIGRQLTAEEKASLDQELESIENWGITVPGDLRVLLHDGTAFHHAGLGLRVRGLVERLFTRGMIRVICATTTLAAGMDLPARTVILSSVRSPQYHRTMIPANTVHQMLGRAGRPDFDNKGFGIVLAGSAGEADQIRRRYFDAVRDSGSEEEILYPRYDPVTSTLGHPTSLTEQLLVALDALGEGTLETVADEFLGESYLAYSSTRNSRSPFCIINLGEVSAEAAIEKHALSDTIVPARRGALGTVSIRESGDTVIGGIVSAWEEGHYTCRFSSRPTSEGLVEGPQCSCGKPMDGDGILCPHLVALGIHAAKDLGTLADYVIPLSLAESSPSETLVKLGLIEGSTEGRFRPTRLGRVVNRLYLGIPTVRELLALLPLTGDSVGLLWLLKHLVSLETNTALGENFEHLIAAAATTDVPLKELARSTGHNVGDVVGLIETSRWLLYSIAAVSEVGGLQSVLTIARNLLDRLEKRLVVSHDRSDGVEY